MTIARLPRALQARSARRTLAASAAALMMTVCGSCDRSASPSSAGRQGTSERVRLQLNWVPEPEFGGLFAAEREGFFRDEGLDVELVKGGPGVAAPQLIASGQVEFGVVAGEQVATLRDAGGALVALFASFQSDPMGIMVHEKSPYRTVEALWRSDATVACETNLSMVAMLNAAFGGSRLRFVPYSGNVAQFASDPALAQQCFVFAEPVALELRGVPTRVFLSSESGYDPYNVVIATNAALARDRPETVRRMRRALARGWRSYLENPGPTNEVMAALNPAMSKEAMDLAARRQAHLIESDDTRKTGLGAMTLERWSTLVQQLEGIGKLRRPVAPSELFLWEPSDAPPAAP